MNDLKSVDVKEWEVLSSCAIIDYVKSKGFANIISLKKNKDNKPYVKLNDKLYVFTNEDSIGEKIDFKNREALMLLSRELARFHNAAMGFMQPPGVKVSVNWGRKMERFRILTSKLEKYIDMVESREKHNSFEVETLPYLDMLLKRAKKSLKILRSIKYISSLETSMRSREVCLNDISSNSVKKYGEQIIITKVFRMGFNMVEEDIGELVKRYLEAGGEREGYIELIREYEEIRGLGIYSEEIIRALVSFPMDSLRTISKYMKSRDKGDVLLDKFKKYIFREMKTDILEV